MYVPQKLKLKKQKILVTGAGGYLGSVICEKCGKRWKSFEKAWLSGSPKDNLKNNLIKPW